jgi:hypothetical protein
MIFNYLRTLFVYMCETIDPGQSKGLRIGIH